MIFRFHLSLSRVFFLSIFSYFLHSLHRHPMHSRFVFNVGQSINWPKILYWSWSWHFSLTRFHRLDCWATAVLSINTRKLHIIDCNTNYNLPRKCYFTFTFFSLLSSIQHDWGYQHAPSKLWNETRRRNGNRFRRVFARSRLSPPVDAMELRYSQLFFRTATNSGLVYSTIGWKT